MAPLLDFVVVVTIIFFIGVKSANLTEQPVLLVFNAGGEVELVGIAACAAIPEHQGPLAIDPDRSPLTVLQLSAKCATGGIERVDLAIP